MPTFPENVTGGGDNNVAKKGAKLGPYQFAGNRYVVITDANGGTSTTTTTSTNTTTQAFFGPGISPGGFIFWQGDSSGSPGTSTNSATTYGGQTAIVDLAGNGTFSTFTYNPPLAVGTVTNTTFTIATETIFTTSFAFSTFITTGEAVQTWKSTDTGVNWTNMDAAHAPPLSQDYPRYSACKDVSNGTLIHVVYWDILDRITHTTFDTVSDLWGTPVTGPQILSFDVADAPINCCHRGTSNTVMVTAAADNGANGDFSDFIPYDVGGGTWGSFSPMGTQTYTGTDSSAIFSWLPMGIIAGLSDLVTALFIQLPSSGGLPTRLFQQSISTGDSPGTLQEITEAEREGGEGSSPFPVDIIYNSTNSKVTVAFCNVGTATVDTSTIHVIDGTSANPVSFSSVTFAGGTGSFFNADVALAHNSNGTYCFWIDEDLTPVVEFQYRLDNGGGFGSPTLVGTMTDISTPLTYDAGGFTSSWAITWMDDVDTNQRYWELVPNNFTGKKMMPQYIKRFNAPGH